MTAREWGGCLPLESSSALPERFEGFGVAALNSGRSAIYAAAAAAKADSAWLPAWLCPTVKEFLEARGVGVREYHVGWDFLPELDRVSDREVVVWTNWLGCMSSEVRSAVMKRFNGRLVIDNCHSYFEPPVRGAWNVYSCRKFLGVPHGAFLVADSVESEPLPAAESDVGGIAFLDAARGGGSNSVYGDYLENEASFSSRYELMNPFVRTFVSSVNEKDIVRKRRSNFDVLLRRFGEFVAPGMSKGSLSPIWFPLYVEDRVLREKLVANRVFVPRLWKRALSDPRSTEAERALAQYLLPLPIDQRYSGSDMEEMGDVVSALMGKCEG